MDALATLLLVSVFLGLAACSEPDRRGGAGDSTPAIPLDLVPEMERIEAVDEWAPIETAPSDEIQARVHRQWAAIHPWVASRVTPELVRDLSRWAEAEMARYATPPSLQELTWAAVTQDESGERLVFAATAERLPAHTPIVTRHLTLYVVYDLPSGAIRRGIVTIRGHAEE